jgi:predicted RNA-binding protein YlxR (DUF448 family)
MPATSLQLAAALNGVARAAPIRTCVGCRQRAPAAQLVRLVLVNDRPTVLSSVDPRGTRAGRGASLHASEPCVRAALAQGAFGRAFRRRVLVVEVAELLSEVMAAWGELA